MLLWLYTQQLGEENDSAFVQHFAQAIKYGKYFYYNIILR